jgi:putative nucleotidyltransferase with HDIG domain
LSAERILVVDDEDAIREVITTLLTAKGYACTAVANGKSALEEVARDHHDLVVSDIVMPELDGLRLLEKIHTHDPELPVVMVTAMHDLGIALQAIRAGAYDYILKPFEKEQLYVTVRRALDHRRVVLENKMYQRELQRLVAERTHQLSHALHELEKSYDYTLEALGGALDAKDAEIEGHCQRVTAITITIAKAMNVDKELIKQMARGAFLHDIGKMGIPDNILRKPGPLNPQERAIMVRHCEIGYGMLERVPFLREAAEIVLTHQECYDGSGYPRGLKGEEIPLGSRIFAIADTLDAIISDRPYRRAQSISVARQEIQAHCGTQFDPKIVEVFLAQPDSLWLKVEQGAGASERLSQLVEL